MTDTIFLVGFVLLVFVIVALIIRSSQRKRAAQEKLQMERAKRQIEMFGSTTDFHNPKSGPPPGMPERRSGKDRRSGIDRRQTVRFVEDRRKGPGRRKEDRVWSGKDY